MVAVIKNTKANKPAKADFAMKTTDLRSSCKLFAKRNRPTPLAQALFSTTPTDSKNASPKMPVAVSSFPLTHAPRAIACRCVIKTAARIGGRCAHVCARRPLGSSAVRCVGDHGRRLFASGTIQRGARQHV